MVPLTSKSINDLFNLSDVEEDEYSSMMTNIKVLNMVTNPESQWIIRKSINVGRIILKEIQDYAREKVESAYFPLLMTSLCLTAQIRSKANLKGQYVQGCIIRHDLERLVENVELFNQVKPNELNELESNESSTKSELEDNSTNAIEET
ncbi:hypothetical protein PVK06_005270 [Gossypium arboreum]|uniref:Uncharacterized protein n=1 Tax=Gossypium arboreum TaxID=29729 RepID=A0ABR0QV64_GOSAR|nr:hypothetical protein PVK06_005270 [Gossypium arboreum]